MLTPIAISGALGLVATVPLPDNRIAFRNALNRGRLLLADIGPRGFTDAIGALALRLFGPVDATVAPAWRRALTRIGIGA
jgi:hypothetical protein